MSERYFNKVGLKSLYDLRSIVAEPEPHESSSRAEVFPSQLIEAYGPTNDLQIKPFRQKDRSQMFVGVLNRAYDCKILCKPCSGSARLRSAVLTPGGP